MKGSGADAEKAGLSCSFPGIYAEKTCIYRHGMVELSG